MWWERREGWKLRRTRQRPHPGCPPEKGETAAALLFIRFIIKKGKISIVNRMCQVLPKQRPQTK